MKTVTSMTITALALAASLGHWHVAESGPLTASQAKGDKASSLAVTLNWLDQTPPAAAQGVSWGVPWPQGKVKKDATFRLADGKGNPVGSQSWPMAYWPDGSLKWSGHAITASSKTVG